MLKTVFALSLLLAVVLGDLRAASHPKKNFNTRNRRGSVAYVTKKSLYMEPVTFGYGGLENQRKNNYDNFLRSNIDNEQDNRNFNNENGEDHLPFRTLNAANTDRYNNGNPAIQATPGQAGLMPLRWNNPHASEMEVNIWVKGSDGAGGQKDFVVPIKKPTCSGEGYQDNVIEYTVPEDFLQLPAKIPGFTGCAQQSDRCVIQFYAHSVESRTYAFATPIVIPGTYAANSATTEAEVKATPLDVGTDVSSLRDLCLPSSDPASNIPNAVPQQARFASDVYNHAYLDSDFSSYSGQQANAISKNLQYSAIIKSVSANGGELGKSVLSNGEKQARQRLRNKSNNLIKRYEGVVNNMLNSVKNTASAKSTGTLQSATDGTQKLNSAVRCANVGCISKNRLTTNTYVPSGALCVEGTNAQDQQVSGCLSAAVAQNVQNKVPNRYKNLLKTDAATGQVTYRIYQAVVEDLQNQIKEASDKYPNIKYHGVVLKQNGDTMPDVVKFKKRDLDNNQDGGQFATSAAIKAQEGYISCAMEGGNCQCNGDVIYGWGIEGAQGAGWTTPKAVTESIACTNAELGDPRVGKKKSCYCKATGSQTATVGYVSPDFIPNFGLMEILAKDVSEWGEIGNGAEETIDMENYDGSGPDECGENDSDPTIGCDVSAGQLVAPSLFALIMGVCAYLQM